MKSACSLRSCIAHWNWYFALGRATGWLSRWIARIFLIWTLPLLLDACISLQVLPLFSSEVWRIPHLASKFLPTKSDIPQELDLRNLWDRISWSWLSFSSVGGAKEEYVVTASSIVLLHDIKAHGCVATNFYYLTNSCCPALFKYYSKINTWNCIKTHYSYK